MNSSYITLGMLGGWEVAVIFVTMLVMAAVVVGVILLVLRLARRDGNPSLASSLAASTVKLAACPRCGIPLPPDAPQGLCPRCVLQAGIETQDAAHPAFRDASGKPNPPDSAILGRQFPQLEILELLGQGGMGAVYKARQKDLDRIVALKILPEGDPAFAERFMREARALARLSHPNIVAVHEFGQVPGVDGLEAAPGDAGRKTVPLYYFIMEFIDGPNLRELMRRQKLSPREALSIVPKICEALQFAHDEGIVHRDIKPENILVDKKGRVKIADFGIAKIVGHGRDAALTGARDVIGTPHYMAPEQVEKPQTVDHRADIYSLGVVFYEMLTGELPLGKFEAPSCRMSGIQVDVRLDEVVLHALEKAPERRYQQASEVRTDVETIAAGPAGSVVGQQPPPSAAGRDPLATHQGEARYCPLAIVGAGWAGIAIVCAVLTSVGITVGALFPFGLLNVVVLGAPIGTTLCGVIALSQIRRSRGRLCGLGLALFDALVFPLLLLDGIIVWLVYLLLCQSLVWAGFPPGTEVAIETALLPAALIILVVNVWLARWAWRSAKRMAGTKPTHPGRNSTAIWVRAGIPVSILLLLAAAALMVATPLQSRQRADSLRAAQRTELEEREGAALRSTIEPSTTTATPSTPVPPVVIRTEPESGSDTVSPASTELRVTFSKPMRAGYWAWVQLNNETYPETTGQPHFSDDARTCILPVRLQPGTLYALWINHEKFSTFQDPEGEPAVPYLLVFKTKE